MACVTPAVPLTRLAACDLDRTHSIVGSRWESLRHGRVFLTGGTGFVGKWLLATLIDADERLNLQCEITVLTRNPAKFQDAAPWLANAPCVTLIPGNVIDFVFPAGPFTHIIHAATDVAVQAAPLAVFDTCVMGTRRVLDLALSSDAGSVLLVSSGAVYGPQPSLIAAVEETFGGGPDPLSAAYAYAHGKRAAESLASFYAAHGLNVKIARCFAFVGPYLPLDVKFAVGNFIRDAIRGERIIVRGDGTAVRSYLHASDMAAWLWAALVDGQQGVAYNVGSSEAVSLENLALLISNLTESTAGVAVLGRTAEAATPDRYVPNVSRALAALRVGRPLGLADALARTFQWYETSTFQHHVVQEPQARGPTA